MSVKQAEAAVPAMTEPSEINIIHVVVCDCDEDGNPEGPEISLCGIDCSDSRYWEHKDALGSSEEMCVVCEAMDR